MTPEDFFYKLVKIAIPDFRCEFENGTSLFFAMLVENRIIKRVETPSFLVTLEAVDVPGTAYVEARMNINRQLFCARCYIAQNGLTPTERYLWDAVPTDSAEMLLQLHAG